jgi:3-deoxy-D-manno-octulosonic-acid transferase
MNRLVYSSIVRALAPALAFRAMVRGRSEPLYAVALGERFGYYGKSCRSSGRPVWVHAVSLGETRAAQPLVQMLLDRGLLVLLTHMTATARREGARLFSEAIQQGRLHQAWLPYDAPGACDRFFTAMDPICGVLIEREVWPNLIHEANKRGTPMVLASARLSARSGHFGHYAGRVLRDAYAGLDAVLAQSDDDAERLLAAGAPSVLVCGNLKFDVALPEEKIRSGHAWRAAWGRPVITVASTHEGEEVQFARAIMNRPTTLKSTLVVIVPRHPQRFDAVEMGLKAMGLRVVRRTAIDPLRPLPPGTQVLLGDSMGELATYYAASHVAIVAGGFVAVGGQNLIEACAVGVPTVVGPHAQNFKQITSEAIASGAVARADYPGAAIDVAVGLLTDDAARASMVTAGLRFVANRIGVARRVMRQLEPFLTNHATCSVGLPRTDCPR